MTKRVQTEPGKSEKLAVFSNIPGKPGKLKELIEIFRIPENLRKIVLPNSLNNFQSKCWVVINYFIWRNIY